MDPMDAVEDERLDIQMQCLSCIEPHHLEIATMGDVGVLKEAQAQLKNLYKYRSPRDKLIIVLNFCRLVVYSIQKVTNKDVSCDEAFPLLILTTILTNPIELHSCIEFIQHFRHPSRHISEEAYAFTLLVSAVQFIREIGSGAHLKISAEDFQRKYAQNRAKFLPRLAQLGKLAAAGGGGKPRPAAAAGGNVLDQLKRFNLSALFRVPLFRPHAAELYEIVEALEYLESYMLDLPLSYQFRDGSLDSPDLINDWRALVAMKKHVTEAIAGIKARARALL